MVTLERCAEHALGLVRRNDVRIHDRRLEPLLLARDRVALPRERVPARVVDDAELASGFREAQIRVVLAQLQPVLGARGEHPVRLGDAARDEIVDQHAEVGLVAARAPAVLAADEASGVDAGEDPLRRGLLVAGRAIDLAGEEEAADRLRLERRAQRARIEVVVLDRVARTQQVRVLAAGDRAHERPLHVEGQRRRDPVRIDLVRREALGLEEDLMARAVGEAHDLVLDRRAIARPDALDHAGEERRAIEAAADDLVRPLVRVRDPAGKLPWMHRARRQEAHHRRGVVARLHRERGEIDRASVEARRRPGLEAPCGKCELAQARAQRLRRRIAGAARLVMVEPDVDEPRQERAGREHDRLRLEADPELRDDAGHARIRAVAVERQIVDRLLEQREVRGVLEPRADRLPVKHAIGLRARRTHRRTLARVQDPELDARFVGGEGHRPAERVELLDQMPLADPADRRIARHLAQRLEVVREQQRLPAHPRAGERGLGAGVAAADDNDVESLMENHDLIDIS